MNWNDGVNCINVYSKGRTELGRLLSNLAHTPFTCVDGHFESVEGYWYWLSTKDNALRKMWGVEAKMYGRRVRGERTQPVSTEFEDKIKEAICKKIVQNHIYNMMAESSLPFVHYYVKESGIDMKDNGTGWMMKHLEICRQRLKDAGFPKERL